MPVTVYLGLGSNLGDRRDNLSAAIDALAAEAIRAPRISPIYETEPIGVTPEPVPNYLNCVLGGETTLSPQSLLDITQGIERRLGRNPTYRWGPRLIDIDMLLYGDVSVESDRLTLPHPRMAERLFVLRPLADLDPYLVVPSGERIDDLLSSPDVAGQRVWPANPLSIQES